MPIERLDAAAAVLARIDPAIRAESERLQAAAHAAKADLQEARHSLMAHEAADANDADAWAEQWGKLAGLVKAHERRAANAEQEAQQAAARYRTAFIHAWRAVRDQEYAAHETFLVESEQRVVAAQQAVIDLDLSLVNERNERQAARIAPLQQMAQQLGLDASEWMPSRQGKYA